MKSGARMLTLEAAAAELGLSVVTTWRLVQAKKLRAVKYPNVRRVLIDRADLEAFIEASKTATKPGRKAAA